MISLLQRAEMRRLFYVEHWPIGTIADALGVHHQTVRRALNRDRGIHPGPQIRPSQLDPYKAFIAATLEQYPRLRATRLWAMLRDRGYLGSAVQVRRYVRTVRPTAPSEAYFRLEPLVAEQGQVDWGNFGAVVSSKFRTSRSSATVRRVPSL
jgi:transposase